MEAHLKAPPELVKLSQLKISPRLSLCSASSSTALLNLVTKRWLSFSKDSLLRVAGTVSTNLTELILKSYQLLLNKC
jgi:hypothetical protein